MVSLVEVEVIEKDRDSLSMVGNRCLKIGGMFKWVDNCITFVRKERFAFSNIMKTVKCMVKEPHDTK